MASSLGHPNAGCAGARDGVGLGNSPSQAEAFSCQRPPVCVKGQLNTGQRRWSPTGSVVRIGGGADHCEANCTSLVPRHTNE